MNKPIFPANDPKKSIADQEQDILKFWQDKRIFEKTLELRNPNFPFKFFDGPPFATGSPHYGHILAGTIKDAIPRYKTMQGYHVARKWGWDCHGVPVEFQVEKEHQIGGKPGIEKMGVSKFNELCRSVVLRCADEWKDTVARMGRFVDFDNDYKTMQPEFMESVWWVFGQLWDKGLIYEGEKVVAYSPKLGSPLSNFEANLNYSDIDDPAVTVKFALTKKSAEKLGVPEGTAILAWTTTPWTLPSNLALCVNPEFDYAVVEQDGQHYIVVENLVPKFFGEDAEISQKIRGKNLMGQNYIPLFPFFKDHQNAFQILGDDFVGAEDGTGIVHMAPNFGEDDARVCADNDVQYLVPNPIDENGYFNVETLHATSLAKELSGKYFRADPEVAGSKENNANDWVLQALKDNQQIFKRDQIRHSYPHCWRTDCALMYRGIKTWFVNVKKIKDQMIEQNGNINWIPDHLKQGRFGKILEGAPDWAISRNRYWGCPIPVWKCDKTDQVQVMSSRSQLQNLCGKPVDDLHKHFIDDLTWPSPFAEGGTMRRIPEVLDCWFESGAMPYGSIHYPFKNSTDFPLNNEFYLMRHGEAEQNVKQIYNSHPDQIDLYELTDQGRADVKKSADKLKEILSKERADSISSSSTRSGISSSIDIIVSSPFKRATQTAEILAEKFGLEVIIDDRIREIHLGEFDGESERDLSAYPADYKFKGGESFTEAQARTLDCLTEYNQTHQGKKILFVSHGGPIDSLLQWINGQDLKWRYACPPKGVPIKLEKSADFSAEKNYLFAVRHGQSTKNIPDDIMTSCVEASQKYPLTDKGREDAETEAKKYSNKFDVIITSPLLRAKQTAEIFQKYNPEAKFLEDIDLRDFDAGIFEGKLVKEKLAWQDENNVTVHDRCPEGENYLEMQERIFATVRKYDQKYQGKRLLFVSHGWSIDCLLDHQKGNPPTMNKHCCAHTTVFDLNKRKKSADFSSFKSPLLEGEEAFQSADFIAEGLDQTRGWFYTLHVLGCALFGKNIYKNVITNGIVLAEDGQKMSKSKKNYPDPNLIFDKYGADAMRFYLLSSPVVRGENFRFAEHGVQEVLKSVILPLKSAYQFFSTYANIDGWKPTKFLFVRHGEAEHNVRKIYSGVADNPHHLTEVGKGQVKETAEYLTEDFDVMIRSPFVRTKETAELIKKIRGFSGDIQVDERVQEPHFGNLEGEKWINPLDRYANETTEHPLECQKRINDFINDMNQKFRGQTLLIVSHGSPIRNAEAYENHINSLKDLVRIRFAKTGRYRTIFPHPQTDNELDLWILSELQTLIKHYRAAFDTYDLEGALRHIPPFIDNLNNWYLRRSRRRFWANGLSEDKIAGYETLHHVLFNLSKILAPICPFFADKLYQDLSGYGSVHLEFMPHVNEAWLKPELETKIGLMREIVSLAAGIRARSKIKLRQPLAKLQFSSTTKVDLDLDVIKAEANVKEIEIISEAELKKFAQKIVRVNAKLVGKKFGPKVQQLIQKGKAGDFETLENGQIKIAGEILEAGEYEVGFLTEDGVEAEATTHTVVLLDTDITDELKTEGYARELIRTIQDLRKTNDFAVSDRIEISYATESAELQAAFDTFGTKISEETLATKISSSLSLRERAGVRAVEVDGEAITLELKQV